MTVFVDGCRAPGRHAGLAGLWSRLTADDLDELHAFARQLGAPRDWFRERCAADRVGLCPHWHYVVNEQVRARAVIAGAVEVDIVRLDATMAARRPPARR